LADRFFEDLASIRGDLYAQVKRLNPQLLQSTGNIYLKDLLSVIISRWLCEILLNLDTQILDSKMAARITLVKVLETMKKTRKFPDPRKANPWTDLLSSLQEECRRPTGLIEDLQNKLGPDFFRQPLTLLLWEPAKGDKVFAALNQIREIQFERAGFHNDVVFATERASFDVKSESLKNFG
jgi:hypothetical protein